MADAAEDKLVDNIRAVAWMLDRRGHKRSSKTAMDAADRIESQAAEIERLTPKDPELARAIEVLNKHQFKCDDEGGEWAMVQREDGLAASNGETIMYTRTAVLTADGLEAAEQEAARA